ncbi:nuclease-related domain-containing protein [Peribacillus sp. NPDC096379]|uniref:nuclease-related domain-containing protein n=1 Tax=Peribacillus sp. NPDC096379 TaxID=3364393 RepID=UPI00381B497F
MFIKECGPSLTLRKMQALLRRLPFEDPNRPIIENDYGKYLAGFRGEQSLVYYLTFLNNKDYLIFHDLRLPILHHFFQLDYLILTANFALILEVKNYSGTVYFDPQFDQLIRTTQQDVEETFPDPVSQVEQHRSNLLKYLHDQKLGPIPIETLVIFSNPYTQLKTTQGNHKITKKVIHKEKFLQSFQVFEKKYSKEVLTHKSMKKVSKIIMRSHTPLDQDLLMKYQVQKEILMSGVHCPICFTLPMEKLMGKWRCNNCTYQSNDAYIESIQDYALLVDTKVTNKEFRNFLEIPSASISAKLLNSMNLPKEGKSRAVTYQLKHDE